MSGPDVGEERQDRRNIMMCNVVLKKQNHTGRSRVPGHGPLCAHLPNEDVGQEPKNHDLHDLPDTPRHLGHAPAINIAP